jgi:hypothetical protein
MHVLNRANDPLNGITASTVRSHDCSGGIARWQFIETAPGVFDGFANLDVWVNAHYQAGRDIVFTLFATPPFYSARSTERNAYSDQDPEPYPYNRGITAEPSDMTKWDAYCTAVATRYLGKIKYYEVWNEPNYQNDGTGATGTYNFFSGTYAKLAEMVRRANQAIKAVDPTAKIISPPITSWSSVPWQGAETYFWGMMGTATGDGSTTMKNWIDIVGVHLYMGGNDITQMSGMIDRIKSVMATTGTSGMEIWDTESAPIGPSASALSDPVLGDVMIIMLLIMAAKGITRHIYYQYDNPGMGFIGRKYITDLREQIISLLGSGNITSLSITDDSGIAIYTKAAS